MSVPKIVSQEEWTAARRELLEKEKELTRQRDRLNTERRELPMVEVTKPYEFEGPDGTRVAARPVRGPPAADRVPLHVPPRVGGRLPQLHRRHRRAVARASSSTSTSATPRTPSCPARRWRSSSDGRPSRAGRSRGTRPTTATSATTSAPPSTRHAATTSSTTAPSTSTRRMGEESMKTAEQPYDMPGRTCFLAGGRHGVPHVLGLRPWSREHRRLVLLPRPHGARPPGGLGAARRPFRRVRSNQPDFAS